MAVTTILFVGVTATVRYLEGEVPAPQAAFLRYAIGTLLLTPSLISLAKFRPGKPLLQKFVLRGLVHSIGVTLWFYAMSVMPVAEVTAIGFLTMHFSEAPPFRELGYMMAFGNIILFIHAVITLPALLVILPGKEKSVGESKSETLMEQLSHFVIKNRKTLPSWTSDSEIACP